MIHDEERFTYAGKSGAVKQTGGRYKGPLFYYPEDQRERYEREQIEHTGKEIGSHTNANVRNDSQPVANAPVSGFNVWVKPAGMWPVGPGDAGKSAPFHIAGTFQSEAEAEAHKATQEIAARFGGQAVQVLVLPTDLFPLPDATIRPTTDNAWGEAREIARGAEEAWIGNMR